MTDHETQRLTFSIVQAGGVCPICDQFMEAEDGLTLLQVAYDHAEDCLKEEERKKYGPSEDDTEPK